jgi:hypothetical protein
MLVGLVALRGHLTVTVLQQKALPAGLHCLGVHFQDLRKRNELVHKLLPDHLLDDVLQTKSKADVSNVCA